MNNNPYQGQYQAPQYSYQQGQQYPGGQNPLATKSGFLTFCFAFVPGAGQMYLGHMKRGVSLSVLFFGLWWISAMVIDGLWIALPVIWMFAFFDTFNLRGHLAAGNAQPDDFLFHLGDSETMQSIVARRHTLIGWALIVLGIWAVYSRFISPAIWSVCRYWNIPFLADFFDNLPSLVLIVVLILLGIWLVRGPKQERAFVAQPEDDIQYYAEPKAAPASAEPTSDTPDSNPAKAAQDDAEQ